MATIDYKQKIKDYMNSSEVDTLYKSMLNNLFPELKENKDKDEKTRKSLIILLQHFCKGYRVPGLDFPVSYKYMLAWLEKQGEHSNFLSKIQVGDKVTRNEDGVLVNLSQLNRVAKKDEKQGEQKPTNNQFTTEQASVLDKHIDKFLEKKSAWSEKYIADVFEKVGLAKIAREQSNDSLTNALQDAMIELSKFTPLPKQEWSEKDKHILNNIYDFVAENLLDKNRGVCADECLKWLKSLKDRYTWKPSKEQMSVLNEVINYAANSELQHWNSFIYTLLKSLREQLKKLREE